MFVLEIIIHLIKSQVQEIMTRAVRILMLCIILIGLASGQIRRTSDRGSGVSSLEKTFSNLKDIPTEENFRNFNENDLPA